MRASRFSISLTQQKDGGDGLQRLAEAHVVGEERAASRAAVLFQPGDAFGLIIAELTAEFAKFLADVGR